MLLIRPQTFETLEQNAQSRFEDDMVVHLGKFHPPHASAAGEEGLRRVIRTGVARARAYGFTLRGPVRFYLEQMILYGHDFDTDPLLPWAGRCLKAGGASELDRADGMHELGSQFQARVVGPDGKHEQAAIRRLLKDPVPAWMSGDLSDAGLGTKLQEVYPQKCAGEPDGLRAIIGTCRRQAADWQLPTTTGGGLFAALAVGIGHGFLADPIYPWAAGTLKDTEGQPGQQRVEKLAHRAMAFSATVLAEHEKE